ncbi:hypothetical protein DRH14_01915 [Candidatus Shapirobacteria bacterium]|nr:MAG: hypothetical protein DRH14_01915 [Candidatus Shapirobacteria bacterium]
MTTKAFIIAKKEIKLYLQSPLFYVFSASLLLITLWVFLSTFFVNNQSTMDPLWNLLVFLFSLFIPAISMSTIAEEKKSGSWEVLLTLPVSEVDIVVGKFFSLFSFILIVMSLYLPMAITLLIIGQPDIGVLFTSFLSMIFLASAYLSCGLFASSLSSQPTTAFLISLIFLILNTLLGQDSFLSYLPNFFQKLVSFLSLSWHAQHLSQGLVSLSDLTFFLSWIAIFLTVTILSIRLKRA